MMKSAFETEESVQATQLTDVLSYQGKKMAVRFKFKDSTKEYDVMLTRRQYENLKSIPTLQYCKTTVN